MAEATGYRAVIDWIRQAVASGALRRGDRLPSEKELCEQFGLSRQTIRHATGELEKEGLLTRVRGSGTYVGGSISLQRTPKYKNIKVSWRKRAIPPSLPLRTTWSAVKG